MSTAGKIGVKTIRLAHVAVNTTALIIVLLLLVYASYALWDTEQVNLAANATRYEKFRPVVDDEGASFEELKAINPEVFSWLTVYGTNIDYPVVQGDDNMKYINTDAMGNYSLSGAIFLDSQSSPDFSDFSNIIYGHHMEKQTMFGEIGLFSDKSYFDARKYGTLYYGGLEHGIEFFAFVHTNAYDNTVFKAKVTGQDEQQMYLFRLLSLALHTREDVPVTTDDRIVLLSTCSESSTNGRDILVGKIIDEVYGDPFMEKPKAAAKTPIASIDELHGLFTEASTEVKLMIIISPLLLIILIIAITKALRNRKRKNARRRGEIIT